MTTAMPDQDALLAALRQVLDPELGCNIVDLGLVYDLQTLARLVRVAMTLTSPGCPMGESLAAGVRAVVLDLPGVEDVEVNLVWEPRWHPSMMTEQGRQLTGIRA